jgi:hypothetical protein
VRDFNGLIKVLPGRELTVNLRDLSAEADELIKLGDLLRREAKELRPNLGLREVELADSLIGEASNLLKRLREDRTGLARLHTDGEQQSFADARTRMNLDVRWAEPLMTISLEGDTSRNEPVEGFGLIGTIIFTKESRGRPYGTGAIACGVCPQPPSPK